MYAVDSSGGDAKPYQLDPGGYLDQAFVATSSDIASVAAVLALPEPDALPTPDTTVPVRYELWSLTDSTPSADVTAQVGRLNSNTPIPAHFRTPVPVEVGKTYFLRVINPPPAQGQKPAQLSLAVYIRALEDEFAPLAVPVCIADREPRRASPPSFEPQGFLLSGNVRPS